MVSKALQFILEATVLAASFTIVPVAVLVWFYLSALIKPIYLVGWLALTLVWTALLTTIYLRRARKAVGRQYPPRRGVAGG